MGWRESGQRRKGTAAAGGPAAAASVGRATPAAAPGGDRGEERGREKEQNAGRKKKKDKVKVLDKKGRETRVGKEEDNSEGWRRLNKLGNLGHYSKENCSSMSLCV